MQSYQISETPTLNKSYTLEDWQGGYDSLQQEFDYWIDDIEGEIPQTLQGTLWRNGPGIFDINGQRIRHPFDGDGMVSRISFVNGRAHFRNRFVRTEGYLAEQKAGKILYRGVFGTQKPGGWLANIFDLKFKNVANTNVIYWGNKLLALWEGAEPHGIDAHTLETLGKEYFDGILSATDNFSAHPRIDPSCIQDDGAPCLVNFAVKSGKVSKITIFELDATGKFIRQQTHQVPGFSFIHDFLITPHHCIFFQNPLAFNPIPFVLGIRSAGECIKLQQHQPTKIIVIPRFPETDNTGVKILETQAGFVFHHVNACVVGDEIVIDSICYDSLAEAATEDDFRQVDFDAGTPGKIWRFHLQLQDGTVKSDLIENRCCEFPSIHPHYVGRDYRYVYVSAAHAATGNAPLQALLKIDLKSGDRQLWSAAPRGFVGEPVFVPSPTAQTEDDGWLLALVYDAEHHRSDVVILDARDLNKGAVARLHLKHHIPYGFHGNFTPEIFI